jgi:hypothetical protein
MRLWSGIAFALLMVGCGAPPPPQPVVQMPGSASTGVTGAKRIVRDGEEFILPDGTRVPADEKGGFRLPNGEYVAALMNGLLLPTGVRCPEDDAGGYVCP